MIAGSTAAVGAAEGVQGIGMALAAVACGFLVDTWSFRCDRVLRFGGLVGLVSCGGFFLALGLDTIDDNSRYLVVTIALGVMGVFQGICSTCLDTLFADSVRTGRRSKFNTIRFALTQLSSVAGPLICIVLFTRVGDEWTVSRVKHVFLVGIGLNVVPVILVFFMSDDHTLGDDSESHYIPSTPGTLRNGRRFLGRVESDFGECEEAGASAWSNSPYAPILRSTRSNQVTGRRPASRSLDEGTDYRVQDDGAPCATVTHQVVDQAGATERGEQCLESAHLGPEARSFCFSQQHIAGLIVASDVISALGSGMSVKFYPLFFKNSLLLTPIQVNTIYVILPIFMTLVSLAAARVAKCCGRVQVCMGLGVGSSLALFGLAYSGHTFQHNDPAVILPLYFLSTLQHSARPLRRAVLMDWVPKAKRARFNSIDSVTRLNWSGSAFLGGLSIDKYGYGHLFFYTALIQMLSLGVLAFLIPLVPVRETDRVRSMSSQIANEDGDQVDGQDNSAIYESEPEFN